MPNLRIAPRNWHDESTLTASQEAVGYPVTGSQSMRRDCVWRSTATALGATIDGTLDSSRTATMFALFRHNLHGGTIRLQLYSDAAWTTGVYDSTTLTISAAGIAGSYEWGHDPGGGTDADPFAGGAPYVLWFSATTFRSYRLTFGSAVGGTIDGGHADTGYFEVGRVWLGRYLECSYNPAPGMQLAVADNALASRTRGGSAASSIGEAWRTLTLDLAYMSEADRPAWLDIARYCGKARDFVLSVFPTAGGRQEVDYMIDGRFTQLDPSIWNAASKAKRVSIEEV